MARDIIVSSPRLSLTSWLIADAEDLFEGRAGFGGKDACRGLSCLIRRSRWGRELATEIAAALVEWHQIHAPLSRDKET